MGKSYLDVGELVLVSVHPQMEKQILGFFFHQKKKFGFCLVFNIDKTVFL